MCIKLSRFIIGYVMKQHNSPDFMISPVAVPLNKASCTVTDASGAGPTPVTTISSISENSDTLIVVVLNPTT